MPHDIPFNRACPTGSELRHVADAVARGELASGGYYTRLCTAWLEERTGARALLVHSCTAALELAALLLEIESGDEVIMPSFTFVSTANAFVLRGGVPVFVDIRPDTLNIDEERIEAAVTPRTRAVVAVHYAGVPCDMDAIRGVADRHGLLVVEDAAQALLSSYRGRPAGSLGDLAATSFHETKNVTSGEGGALLVDDRWVARAEILRDKGTNRSRFFRGEVDKYSWLDVGSSYGLSELNAAFLWAQLEGADALTAARRRAWERYHAAFAELEASGAVRRPVVPPHVDHNAHLYYLLVATPAQRARLLAELNRRSINAVFHYVSLHSSPAGRRYGRVHGQMSVTDSVSEALVRLPLWNAIPDGDVDRVVDAVYDILADAAPAAGTSPRANSQ